jgi:hypothetical protein
VLLVELFNDVFVVVLAVNVDQHGFDGCVALDERACEGQHGGGGTEAGNVPLIALTISESLPEYLRGVGGLVEEGWTAGCDLADAIAWRNRSVSTLGPDASAIL